MGSSGRGGSSDRSGSSGRSKSSGRVRRRGSRSGSGGGRLPNRASGTRHQPGRQRGPRHRGGIGGEQVEGRQAVRELLLAGRRRARTLLVARGLASAVIVDDIVDLARQQKVRVKHLGRSEFESASRSASPQGVIAYADPLPTMGLIDLISGRTTGNTARPSTGTAHHLNRSPFLLVLDGITDPGNLGAVLRTAECSGVTGVVMRSHRSAQVTPTAAKAAAGAVEYLRFAVVPGLPAALSTLSKHRVWTVGLDAAGQLPIYDLELAEEAIALVLGAEGRGLSRLVSQRCDVLASIPLHGVLSSLNVSAAAAVACYQISRDRGYRRAGQSGT